MKNIDKIKLTLKASIKDALQTINDGAMQIALIVDEEDKLLGTITDGDIRRGLLNNLTLDDNINKIIYKTPTVCSISDTKEKILEKAIKRKLYQVPIVDDSGKLIGLEEVDELLKLQIKPNKVVLMVGGLGTRLRPLTNNIPKPMLKVGNRPILETIILNFKKYGFVNIILCVGYKSNIIKEYFKDGSEFGVNIEYIYEDKRMGTAGALTLTKDKLNKSFFVMNGDLLTDVNFEHMMKFHSNTDSIATMAVREYDFQVPYGVVNIEGSNVLNIEEKPIHKFFVSGGIYLLEPESIKLIPKDTFYDMPTLLDAIIKKNKKVLSFPIYEYWLDIGQHNDFIQANNEYAKIFLEKGHN